MLKNPVDYMDVIEDAKHEQSIFFAQLIEVAAHDIAEPAIERAPIRSLPCALACGICSDARSLRHTYQNA
ncbi:hypothetical protein PPGU19_068050 (plasmid) [Paraburkholderia sp. PGU19]|nr:hypothetical protein PPGU19_068050 [Paraburkholderia sp. PGU19]